MEIVIKIPKEFEEHFNSDRFEDSLQRVRFDIHKSIIGNKSVLSRKYEIETLDMLTEAFLNSTPLPKRHGRIIDESRINRVYTHKEEVINNNIKAINIEIMGTDAPTIIEANKTESEDKE